MRLLAGTVETGPFESGKFQLVVLGESAGTPHSRHIHFADNIYYG
jgi:hypothetical protein